MSDFYYWYASSTWSGYNDSKQVSKKFESVGGYDIAFISRHSADQQYKALTKRNNSGHAFYTEYMRAKKDGFKGNFVRYKKSGKKVQKEWSRKGDRLDQYRSNMAHPTGMINALYDETREKKKQVRINNSGSRVNGNGKYTMQNGKYLYKGQHVTAQEMCDMMNNEY